MAKNKRNIHGAVPKILSRYHPRPAPIAIARTNEMPTVLSAPMVRIVSAVEFDPRFGDWGSSIALFFRLSKKAEFSSA
jgi:hypothetical protein